MWREPAGRCRSARREVDGALGARRVRVVRQVADLLRRWRRGSRRHDGLRDGRRRDIHRRRGGLRDLLLVRRRLRRGRGHLALDVARRVLELADALPEALRDLGDALGSRTRAGSREKMMTSSIPPGMLMARYDACGAAIYAAPPARLPLLHEDRDGGAGDAVAVPDVSARCARGVMAPGSHRLFRRPSTPPRSPRVGLHSSCRPPSSPPATAPISRPSRRGTRSKRPTTRNWADADSLDRPVGRREGDRRHTLLPLEESLYALQLPVPHLRRPSLHRSTERRTSARRAFRRSRAAGPATRCPRTRTGRSRPCRRGASRRAWRPESRRRA